MTQTPKPKLSDMSGYGADDVVILERKTYEELLAALKAMMLGYDFGEHFPSDHPIIAARAAIAKAEGE